MKGDDSVVTNCTRGCYSPADESGDQITAAMLSVLYGDRPRRKLFAAIAGHAKNATAPHVDGVNIAKPAVGDRVVFEPLILPADACFLYSVFDIAECTTLTLADMFLANNPAASTHIQHADDHL